MVEAGSFLLQSNEVIRRALQRDAQPAQAIDGWLTSAGFEMADVVRREPGESGDVRLGCINLRALCSNPVTDTH